METPATIETESAAPLLRAVLINGVARLAAAGVAGAPLDAELLLGHALGLTREQLLVSSSLPLSEAQVRLYAELLSRRIAREPIAYILGRQEFWSLEFQVTPDVLIPRPETERLVEVAVELARDFPGAPPSKILDVGTGSGVIAICLAKELPTSSIWASDVSAPALSVAQSNASRHQVEERIHFLQGDLFAPVRDAAARFDLIVANPPYIRSAEIDRLEPEIRGWEPRGALDGGIDGLDFYRQIAAQAYLYLTPHGAVFLEIGADLASQVKSLFLDAAGYADMEIFCDCANRDRVVVARKSLSKSDSTRKQARG